MTNNLQNKLEGTLITRTFHVGGMPESVFKEIDAFCKEYYGDSRWTMIADLHRAVRDDYKYNMLYDDLQDLKREVGLLQTIEEPEVKVKSKITTFGSKKEQVNEMSDKFEKLSIYDVDQDSLNDVINNMR